MIVKILNKKQIRDLINLISKDVPVIIIKNYIKQRQCYEVVNYCHKISKKNKHRILGKNGDVFSLDILPSKVKTERIFRMFEFGRKTREKFKFINDILRLQKRRLLKLNNKNKKIYSKVQVLHYPRGGGFFAEHKHARYPTNYGLILTLTKKNKDFKEGVTNIRFGNKIINLEKYNISTGDLILFRYDLSHFITPVDPNSDLTIDNKGRWTMIFPVHGRKFGIY